MCSVSLLSNGAGIFAIGWPRGSTVLFPSPTLGYTRCRMATSGSGLAGSVATKKFGVVFPLVSFAKGGKSCVEVVDGSAVVAGSVVGAVAVVVVGVLLAARCRAWGIACNEMPQAVLQRVVDVRLRPMFELPN